jgi:3-deoxy-manno-octulosonate cytidylyltransferase (CMP-KDO synthetase)
MVVIPARMKSTRLPGKPLVMLRGVPMIVRTYRQCAKVVPTGRVVVATDDSEIADVCASYDVPTFMTSPDCLTGTDRVAEVARTIIARSYINVQGDEPLFDSEDVIKVIEAAKMHPEDIVNGFCAIDDESLFFSQTIPKVVLRPDGRLLYMSRAPIPGRGKAMTSAWRQVCAYAFPREKLLEFASSAKKTPLESIEDIEILRFLELGHEVRMIELSSKSIAVDTPTDVTRVEIEIDRRDRSSST